ncbi:hypothetical protein KNU49_gp119 [Streptomyces phage EGole]|uniref:Uncharacterized protein n=1 Tax=Streptomyces phage EGole TaxID=2517973 RepID=A0A482JH88_9CAUD|nr:hypothetical protein KNU49_gp119 [Streptomyces phage EGole]QBP30936.1 hypothetical protein SEA_EGOLE_189 [Streptomyces phage EGole]
MRTYEPDEWTLEMALGRAMDNDGLTYGEVVAIMFLTQGWPVDNNNPGVFKSLMPIKE